MQCANVSSNAFISVWLYAGKRRLNVSKRLRRRGRQPAIKEAVGLRGE